MRECVCGRTLALLWYITPKCCLLPIYSKNDEDLRALNNSHYNVSFREALEWIIMKNCWPVLNYKHLKPFFWLSKANMNDWYVLCIRAKKGCFYQSILAITYNLQWHCYSPNEMCWGWNMNASLSNHARENVMMTVVSWWWICSRALAADCLLYVDKQLWERGEKRWRQEEERRILRQLSLLNKNTVGTGKEAGDD